MGWQMAAGSLGAPTAAPSGKEKHDETRSMVLKDPGSTARPFALDQGSGWFAGGQITGNSSALEFRAQIQSDPNFAALPLFQP